MYCGIQHSITTNDKFSRTALEKDETETKLMSCKHCNMKFSRRRGFKLHVQLTHLKRLGFLCPYCDRSTNSEQIIRQHIRTKHRGCEMKIIQNPAAGGPELTNEFWEKEYGLVSPYKPLKINKRSKSSIDNTKDDKGSHKECRCVEKKCEICGFLAVNYVGLKAHMRSHITKSQFVLHKCPYCIYSSCSETELMRHWQLKHPRLPYKMQTSTSCSSGDSSSNGSPQAKKQNIYVDDIEEEQIDSPEEEDINITIYSCIYCNKRSHSLVFLMRHWDLMHKEELPNSSNANTTTDGMPFKYKEYQMSAKVYKREQMLSQKKKPNERMMTENPKASYDLLICDDSSNPVSDQSQACVCQWCKEVCETKNDMEIHQNMFHSHLPLRFKRKQQERRYICNVCSYTSNYYEMMKKHVVKHMHLFKCKYCDEAFDTPAEVSAHSFEKHPGIAMKVESISNFDATLDKLIKRSEQNDAANGGDDTAVKSNLQDINILPMSTGHAVARKSTIKSILPYMKPGPRIFKAVARKSTNPLPKHLREDAIRKVKQHSLVMKKEPEKAESVQPLSSHYGVPSDPINLAKVNTYMMLGGHSMKVSCTTLAQLININPKLVLEDIKHDSKYAEIL